jgi:hypothetical protein
MSHLITHRRYQLAIELAIFACDLKPVDGYGHKLQSMQRQQSFFDGF